MEDVGMGLRVKQNIKTKSALPHLRQADRSRNADMGSIPSVSQVDPDHENQMGQLLSGPFRTQIETIAQTLVNAQPSVNLIKTAESALKEVSDLLGKIRKSTIFAKNSNGLSVEESAAEQDLVDKAVHTISRIARSTRYGRVHLLNGSADFVASGVSTDITDLELHSVYFGDERSVVFNAVVTQPARRATLGMSKFTIPGGGILRISGGIGTKEVEIKSSIATAQVVSAIDSCRNYTGVYGSGTSLFSESFGSKEFIRVEVVSGVYQGASPLQGTGQDIGVELRTESIEAESVEADGLHVQFNSKLFRGGFKFNPVPEPVLGSHHSIGVRVSGLVFPPGSDGSGIGRMTVGICSVDPLCLGSEPTVREVDGGVVGGYLDSLVSGGTNDLSSDPGNAIEILDAALSRVNGLRTFLESISRNVLNSITRSSCGAFVNVVANEGSVRGLDFVSETTEFTRAQVLSQAGAFALASLYLFPQTVPPFFY
jgi:flagellin